MKTLLKGQKVMVNLSHKRIEGVVTKDCIGEKYVSVKHDNFKDEVFKNLECWIIVD